MRSYKFVASFLVLMLVAGIGAAQTGWSKLTGQTVDQSGAAVPGATLVLFSEATGYRVSLAASATGEFAFLSVPGGDYVLSATQTGFETTRTVIHVGLNQPMNLPNLMLKIGNVFEEVTVGTEINRIETSGAALRTVVTEEQIRDYPVIIGLEGRSILASLLELTPGASNYPPLSTDPNFRVTVNGSPIGGIGYSLNGVDVTALGSVGGGTLTTGPNQDAIAGFSVLTHTFDAESGSIPVQVHLETKSGTNSFHGQLRFFHLDPTVSARDFFDQAKKTSNRRETGGVQLSGPVLLPGIYKGRNKTFFFFDSELSRARQQSTSFATVLSNAERVGDFSGLASSKWPRDPLTGLAFPDGLIPADRVLPQSRHFIDDLIRPATNGRQIVDVFTQKPWSRQNTVRIDHRYSDAGNITFNFFEDKYEVGSPIVAMQQGATREQTWTHSVSIQHRHRFSSGLMNSISFGATAGRYMEGTSGKMDASPKETGFNITTDSRSGYPGVGLSNTGGFDAGTVLSQDWTSLWNVKENLELVTGPHVFKAGADIRVLRGTFRDESNGGAAGGFGFSDNNPNGTGNDVADFLLGLPVSYSQSAVNVLFPRRLLTAFYFQDEVRLRSNLKVNLGLRYDLNGAWHDANGHMAVFRPGVQSKMVASAPPGMLFSGDVDPVSGRKITKSVHPVDHTELAPRVGISYSPFASNGLLRKLLGGAGRTSIRSGYGIYYVSIPQQAIYRGFSAPPYSMNISLDASQLAQSGGAFLNPWGSGIDPFSLPINDRTAVRPISSLAFVQPGAKEAYQQQWSLSISRQIMGSMALSVNYAGSKATHLFRQHEANPGVVTAGATVNNVNDRRLYPDFRSIAEFTSDGRSVYHSLQIDVNRRFTSRFQFNGSYVWSRSTDDGGSALALSDSDATPWARSGFDRKHQFVLLGVLDLRSAPLHRLRPFLSGWRMTPLVTIRSGVPLNLRNQYDSTLRGIENSTAEMAGTFLRLDPREVHTFKLPNGNTVTGHFFFDPTAFQILSPVGPDQARPGNLGRNPFTGLGRSNVDVSLTKRIAINERQGVEVRIDATNVMNHAQFVFFPAALRDGFSNFGLTTQTYGPRRMQFVLKYSF